MTDLAPLLPRVRDLLDLLDRKKMRVTTAESCTGGLLAAALTEVPGSSTAFDRGFVTYSNEAKTDLLGVPKALLDQVGAVSEEVAIAMAEGALARTGSDLAVAVTGIAGPGGGSPEKPVGLVHFAVARKNHPTRHAVHIFADLGREAIRLSSVEQAMALLGLAATN